MSTKYIIIPGFQCYGPPKKLSLLLALYLNLSWVSKATPTTRKASIAIEPIRRLGRILELTNIEHMENFLEDYLGFIVDVRVLP